MGTVAQLHEHFFDWPLGAQRSVIGSRRDRLFYSSYPLALSRVK